MLENKINNLIKYVGIVFVFVLCFSLMKTKCFAASYADYPYFFPGGSSVYNFGGANIRLVSSSSYYPSYVFVVSDTPISVVSNYYRNSNETYPWRNYTFYLTTFVEELGGYTDINFSSGYSFDIHFSYNSSYINTLYKDSTIPIYRDEELLNPVPEYKEDLYDIVCSVYFLNLLNRQNAVLDIDYLTMNESSFSHVEFTINGNLGEFTYDWDLDDFGGGFLQPYHAVKMFNPSVCNNDGICYWKLRVYDTNGNWGSDYGGVLNFNTTLGKVPGTNKFFFANQKVDAIDVPVEGIQTSKTYIIPQGSTGSLSTVINNVVSNSSPVYQEEYYSYDFSEFNETTTNELITSIVTNSSNTTNNDVSVSVSISNIGESIEEKLDSIFEAFLSKLQEIKEEIVSLGKKVGKGDRPDINIFPPVDIDIGPFDIDIGAGTNPYDPDGDDETMDMKDLVYIILLVLYTFELLGDVLILCAKFLHWIVHIFNIPASAALIMQAENGQHFVDAITVLKGGTALGLEEPITLFGMSLFSFMVIIFQLALIGALIAFVRKLAVDIELPKE